MNLLKYQKQYAITRIIWHLGQTLFPLDFSIIQRTSGFVEKDVPKSVLKEMDRDSLEYHKRCLRETASIINTWRSALETSGVEMKYRLGVNEIGLREYGQSRLKPDHSTASNQHKITED